MNRARVPVNPFEVVLCLVFITSVISTLAFGPATGTTAASLGAGTRAIWLGLTMLGCVLTLVGIYATRVWGYIVEQVGLMAAGWALIAFGAQAFAVSVSQRGLTPATVLGGPLICALGVAFLWRRHQVMADIRFLKSLNVEGGDRK